MYMSKRHIGYVYKLMNKKLATFVDDIISPCNILTELIKKPRLNIELIDCGDIVITIICEYLYEIDESAENCIHFIHAIRGNVERYKHTFIQYCDPWPSHARHLETRTKFNNPIHYWPPHTRSVCFGFYFNQQIHHWPALITHVYFGLYFQQEITEWPTTITHIRFNHGYRGHIYNLPDSLIKITVSEYYKYLTELRLLVGGKMYIY